ncbi:MAG: LysR family transcriptional regulator [Burkholderiales bacterium]
MTFKQLEALYWIAQLGGFAQAAARLHASQSAISKRIHELEQRFAVELFDRKQRSARLTEKGEELFLLAKRLLEQRDSAVEQFSGPEVTQRRLRIGVTELTAMTWLPRLILAIQTTFPKVVIEPTVEDTALLKDKLLDDELDLIIVPDAFTELRLLRTPLGRVESAWMCRPGHIERRGVMPLHELARHRLLVQGDTSGTGRIYGAWMKAQGVAPDNVIGVSNLMAVLGLAVSGMGIGYLPRACLQPMLDANTLRVVKVKPALPMVDYVALRRDEGRSRLLTTIIDLAKGCCDFSRTFQAQAS